MRVHGGMLEPFRYLHVLSVRFLIYGVFWAVTLAFLLLLVHLHLVLYGAKKINTLCYMNNDVIKRLQKSSTKMNQNKLPLVQ